MFLFERCKRFLVRSNLNLRLRLYRRENRVAFVVLNLHANISTYSKIGAMEALDKNNYRLYAEKRDDSRSIANVLYSPSDADEIDCKKAVSLFFDDTALPADQVLTVYSWSKD